MYTYPIKYFLYKIIIFAYSTHDFMRKIILFKHIYLCIKTLLTHYNLRHKMLFAKKVQGVQQMNNIGYKILLENKILFTETNDKVIFYRPVYVSKTDKENYEKSKIFCTHIKNIRNSNYKTKKQILENPYNIFSFTYDNGQKIEIWENAINDNVSKIIYYKMDMI